MSSHEPTNDGLVAQLARLDSDADGRAWALVQAAVGAELHAAARRAGGAAVADDAVQEALLRLRRGAPSFRRAGVSDDAAALRWCRRVAANAAHGLRLRAQRRQRHELLAAVAGDGARDDRDPIEDAERRILLHALVARLPPPERSAVEARVLAGRSTAAIAIAGARSEDTVRWRLRRALARLRDGMRRAGYLALAWLALAPRRAAAATTPPAAAHAGISVSLMKGILVCGSSLVALAMAGSLLGGAIGSADAASTSNTGLVWSYTTPSWSHSQATGYIVSFDGKHLRLQDQPIGSSLPGRSGTIDISGAGILSIRGIPGAPATLSSLKRGVSVRVVVTLDGASGKAVHITILPH